MSPHALVIGAGSGVGRATVLALRARGRAVTAVGRQPDRLVDLDGAGSRAVDAAAPGAARSLLAELDPDLVVIAAGVRPRLAPIDQHDWESFSAPWNADVKIAFEVGVAALQQPLRPGSTVVIVSSGAGLGGSPLSGGYAGAKRMQMFLASYLQRESNTRGLGLRFVAAVPRQLIEGTDIGAAAAAAYAAEAGISVTEYLTRFPVPIDAAGVAALLLDLADGRAAAGAAIVGLTGKGLEVL